MKDLWVDLGIVGVCPTRPSMHLEKLVDLVMMVAIEIVVVDVDVDVALIADSKMH